MDVWYDHKIVASFPDHFQRKLKDGLILQILDDKGKVVREFPHGKWHAVGSGIRCASHRDSKKKCKICKKD